MDWKLRHLRNVLAGLCVPHRTAYLLIRFSLNQAGQYPRAVGLGESCVMDLEGK